MRLTREGRELVLALLAVPNFPEDVYVDLANSNPSKGLLTMQAETQAEVRRVRAAFPAVVFWRKTAPASKGGWWEYHGDSTDLGAVIRSVRVYACREAPPTCRAIEEQVQVVKQVPVQWEAREVTETVVRWDCGTGEGEEGEQHATQD